MSPDRQRGEGKTGMLIALIVVGVVAFVALKYIPVRIDAYNFKDVLREECRMGAVRGDDATVASRIMRRAEEIGVPLERDDLKIKRSAGKMIISASYTHPIDFKVKTYRYRFHHVEQAPLF